MNVRAYFLSPAVARGMVVLCAAVFVAAAPSIARAGGVVGTGTAASCTDAALDAALAAGGMVTFNCGGGASIDVSTGTGTKTISADTTIDGDGAMNITGGYSVGVFVVNSGVKFTVRNVTIANGFGGQGGGIQNSGVLTVTNSTFTGNNADHGGGGIVNLGGTVTVTNCTFFDNNAAAGGGIQNSGALTVTNSTFTHNGAEGGGGGIFNVGGTVTVTNCTFSDNSAAAGGNLQVASGSAILRNTVVDNDPPNDSCRGHITDGGHNLDAGTSCGFRMAKGSLSNTDPQLDLPGVIGDTGGPTQTVALCTGTSGECAAASPAIDAGDPTVCAAPPVNNRDQRGFVRPGTGHTRCSIGAYEDNATPPGSCIGDCNGNGIVAINELLLGVGIALGIQPVNACPAFAGLLGTVDIAQLATGVNNALNGCAVSVIPPLTVEVPLVGAVAHGGSQYYSVAVTPGTPYSMSIVGLSNFANLDVFSDRWSEICRGLGRGGGPLDCHFTTSGDTAFVRVDGSFNEAAYTAFLVAYPSVMSPVTKGTRDAPVTIADGLPRLSQVSQRGTSFYVSTALPLDQPHVVAITGLTGAADLHVYPDATYSFELDCTFRNLPTVDKTPQDCVVSGKSALYFSVSSGILNRDGAAYEVLVK